MKKLQDEQYLPKYINNFKAKTHKLKITKDDILNALDALDNEMPLLGKRKR